MKVKEHREVVEEYLGRMKDSRIAKKSHRLLVLKGRKDTDESGHMPEQGQMMVTILMMMVMTMILW